jgi:hypothetical protein
VYNNRHRPHAQCSKDAECRRFLLAAWMRGAQAWLRGGAEEVVGRGDGGLKGVTLQNVF